MRRSNVTTNIRELEVFDQSSRKSFSEDGKSMSTGAEVLRSLWEM